MSKLLFTMTDAGRQELVNANKTGTNKVEIVSVGLGSRYYATSTTQTKITDEIKRLTTIGGKVVSPDTIHVTAKDDSKDEYVVHTIGLYTNKGTLFAVYSQEQVIINKASSTIALISSDIAIKNLDTKNITFGDVEFINPPATETVVGVARFANEQEIDAGTDDSLAVSAKRLKQAIVKHEQSRNHPDATLTSKGIVQLSNATNSTSEKLAATPKAVKAAYDLANGKYTAQNATTTQKGIVQLSSATNSTSETLAATPKAVKVVMDETNKKAPLNSPALTGTPTTPTAPQGTNNAQIASTAYVMAAIAALVDSSPDALNTLSELAAALGNDPNFATTVIDALAGKQPKDATLTALAELATSADKLPYFTGANRAALTALTSVGREIISKTSTEDVLDYLRLTEIIDKFHSQITTCERNSRVENFYTLAETCTAELLSLNAPEAYDKSITLTVNEELTTDYTGPVTGHCSIGDPQSYTIAMCTSTTLEYQVSSVVLESDGTFSFARSWPGAKAFKLYRTSNNGLVTVREDPLCIRSYRMPSDAGDETVRVMKDRTYTYDQAVSAIALMAQGHSQTERFVRGLCAIVGSGGSEGSVPFFVNRMSAQTSSQYYRTGNAAWVAYALAYYLLKYPDGEMAVVARDKLTQCAEWIEMFRVRDGSDVRSGLYTSGSGQYLNGVFYPDFDADWCASEHQFDLWFLFDLMGRLGFTGYAEKAKALADAIMEKLWVEDEGRFYAGMRTTGVDKASPLDCASWGGLFVANIDMEKARRCFTYLGRLWYATHDATGYTPYHPEYGYPNKQRGVWVEGSAGVALLARRLGDDTTAMDILARLAPLRTRYGYIDSCDYPDNDDMPPWPSSCNTAWMILACDPQGFWNVNSPVLPGRYYKY
ncbi:tail fiber protein [Escherichia coli]|nr:tail fiber protein [Escherichia coli]EJT9112280.1 tail fiber protein [Escherichia coli]ELM9160375.1 tail fiber protein [Escherichia coli]